MFRGVFAVAILVGCGHTHHGGDTDAGNADAVARPPCVGLACFQYDCAAKGLPPTSVSGQIFAPNGTLQLYGVNVYVPSDTVAPLPDGVQCDKCSAGIPGALAATKTDENGHFELDNVPVTGDVPIVIQVGKWRRQITLPATPAACQNMTLDPALTRLPKDRSEGDLPRIAITTGGSDALECLVRKLGIADSEITTQTKGGRVNLFANINAAGVGATKFAATYTGDPGATFSDAAVMWGSLDTLKKYDIVMFSCEGGQYPATKPQTALQAVHDYADLGGRVFLSHWHNIWIGGDQNDATHMLPDWKATSTFDFNAAQDQDNTTAVVDETVTNGMSFATWLMNTGASTVRDQIPISGARYTCKANDPTKSDRQVYLDPALSNNHVSVQDLQFTTPQNVDPGERCGKVVFSDMHVASGSTSSSGTAYPGGCSTTPLSPQEKALAFIFFDIASCVGPIQ